MHWQPIRPQMTAAFITLFLVVSMATACGAIEFETAKTSTPAAIPASVSTQTSASETAPDSQPSVVLECPSSQRVELSVLVEPLDSGNVEIGGSEILTNGGATPVCKDDQMNIIARPNQGWIFDHWELDINGTRSTEVIVMTSSKKIRAMFIRANGE